MSLTLRRGGTELVLEIPAGDWGLTVRPRLGEDDLEAYRSGLGWLREGRLDAAIAAWRDLAERWGERGEHLLQAAWLSSKIGRQLIEVGRADEGLAAIGQGLRQAEKAGDWEARVQLRRLLAKGLAGAGRLGPAAETLESLLVEQEDKADRLALARTLTDLGDLNRKRSELARAQSLLERSREILLREAPESYALARCLRNLAITHFVQGSFAGGELVQLEALRILDNIAPVSRLRVDVLTNQASLVFRRGNLRQGEELFREALGVRERFGPESRQTAVILANLASLARRRGDHLAAERLARRAVAMHDEVAPGHPPPAAVLAILGDVALARGDLEGATRWLGQALAAQDEIGPDDPVTLTILAHLSWVAFRRDLQEESDEHYRDALERLDCQSVQNIETAVGLKLLARLKLEQGDAPTARRLLGEILELEERLVPDSLALADSLQILGQWAFAEGRFQEAESLLERTLRIQRQNGVEIAEARSSQILGQLLWKLGRKREALELMARACFILDRRRRYVGADYQTLAELRAQNHDIYRDYLHMLVQSGDHEEAFHVLERSRSQAFREILAMRDVRFTADLPADLERRRRLANEAYDDALWHLLTGGPGSKGPKREALNRRLTEARQERDEVRASIRIASPRLAALESPKPLRLRQATQALEPGTLLLSYAVAREHGYLLTVGPDPGSFEVYSLGLGQKALSEEVLRFRSFLRPGANPEPLQIMARRLSELLLAPAAEQLARAERIVIVSDGALHELPFAALADPTSRDSFRYLVEVVPISRIDSVTSFAELKARRGGSAAVRVAAFGDPVFTRIPDRQLAAEPVFRSALESGLRLDPLPASRLEVEEIGRIFGTASRTYLGHDATEEQAKAVDRDTRILHIASHGFVDDHFPLESGVVLTIPSGVGEKENGILQAWEVFERLRIDAELVTLSGCDTGGGKELAGEGMVGLTRAFQYAGARTVLASSWKVSDDSTHLLMSAFYRNLQQGLTKDEALRRAQLQLVTSPEPSLPAHPFYWAAFQLIGDWQ